MNLQAFSEEFESLSPQKKISFIYSNIGSLTEQEKISFLLSIIEDKKGSPIVLATAIKFLANTSYIEFEIFHNHLRHRNLAVVKAARKALKNIGPQDEKDKYISRSILKNLKSLRNKQKRLKMIKALVRLKTAWIPQLLLDGLEDPSEEIRDCLVKELGQRENLDLNLVYQKMTKPPWYVKSACLKILGIRKNPASIKHIETVLDEPNVDVRRTAAHTLGEIGGSHAVALLVKLTKDKNPHVKTPAEEAIRRASDLKFT